MLPGKPEFEFACGTAVPIRRFPEGAKLNMYREATPANQWSRFDRPFTVFQTEQIVNPAPDPFDEAIVRVEIAGI